MKYLRSQGKTNYAERTGAKAVLDIIQNVKTVGNGFYMEAQIEQGAIAVLSLLGIRGTAL
jgi:hypothetical protein